MKFDLVVTGHPVYYYLIHVWYEHCLRKRELLVCHNVILSRRIDFEGSFRTLCKIIIFKNHSLIIPITEGQKYY